MTFATLGKYLALSSSLILFVWVCLLAGRINPYSIPPLIGFVTVFCLGIFVYLKGKKRPIHKLFLFLTISLSIWFIDLFGLCILSTQHLARTFCDLASIGLVFTPPILLHFVLYYTYSKVEGRDKLLLYISYILSTFFYMLHGTSLYTKGLAKSEFGYIIRSGPGYNIFVLYASIVVSFCLYKLIKRYRESTSKIERNHLMYIFLACLLTFICSLVGWIVSLGGKIYPMYNFAVLIFTSIVSYAILKHRLMDIRVAIKWGVFYSGLTILVGGIYILLVCLFSPIFWGVREGQVITFSIFVAVATVCFYPLLNSVQKVAYKTLSHERREHQLVVKQFSEEVGSLMRIEEVLSLFLDRLHLLLKIRTGAVLLRDDTSGSFELKVSKGFAIKRPEEWEIPQRKDIVVWMEGRKEVFLKEEGELGFYADDTTDLIVSIGEIIKELDRFETKLCAPILSKGKLIGLLFLGEKGPGDMFSQEDLNAIRTLCNQVGIAIENIRLLDEVSKIREELHNQDKLAALGILTSKIAHEIKNPLVPIKTFVQLLPHKSSDQSFLKRFNSIVPQELERLEKVLDEILTVSRLTPSHLQEIKVEDVIKDTLLLVDAELSRQKIRVEENYFEPAHSIMGDAGRLKQAFMNLILNAAQAMNEGGRLSISTNLISGNDRDPRLEVKIQDDGVGISSENIKRIFEPFFTTRQSGTGLGLSIAKGIVEEHNGSICVESELGKGTIFTLTFPIQGKSNSSIS